LLVVDGTAIGFAKCAFSFYWMVFNRSTVKSLVVLSTVNFTANLTFFYVNSTEDDVVVASDACTCWRNPICWGRRWRSRNTA